MGESARGSSIYHHLTAFGGKDQKRLFQRAIPQSTGWWRTDFSSPILLRERAPQAHRKHMKNVDLLIGFNEDEGLTFTSPESNDDAGYRKFLESNYSNASPEMLGHIESKLNPRVFDAESEFTCKYGFLQAAYGNRAKSYRFNVYPGLNGSEVDYTFFSGPERNPNVAATIAVRFQELLTSFAATDHATSPAVPNGVSAYGEESRMLYIDNKGFGITTDQTVQERCKFW
ncbi:hypothetical protein F53441_1665 [Fusarium austroafricanum]|uniref:Carboxylesterase type B domain-containing protein n=1 Tax=Fusarium austroafricanum TaxID=2364996 RepID=A0A8H4P4U3_9HYPO|nr:hypothetical protein F53441_1665 [Fusarium austroafricanum]